MLAGKNSRVALHHIKLKQVVSPAGAAAKLADLDCDMCLNNLEGFSLSHSTKLSLSLVSLALFLLENENDMKEPAPLATPASAEPAEVARTPGFFPCVPVHKSRYNRPNSK